MRKRHLALLRGINVGGKNRLPMETLRGYFEDAGCADVETYIQSGNVIFSAPARVLDGLGDKVQQAIARGSKIEVPVILRTGDALAAAVKANPFLAQGASPEVVHLVFLAGEPNAAAVAALDASRSLPDRFVVRGREIYLHCPNGYGRSKLTNAWFDAKLKTVSTVRNWRTVLELLARCGARAPTPGPGR
jgi:uncharacterized protein (DUF1697 family)